VSHCPAQEPAKPIPVEDIIRVESALVQTDVMVFDKSGTFVNGLQRGQFALKVDGKPRDIAFFEQVRAGSRNEEAQLAAARGTSSSAAESGAPVPLDRGRTIFFFVDDLHMSAGNLMNIRKLLARSVDDLEQNDQAAIFNASGTIGFLQQLTNNKAVLRAAIERISPHEGVIHDLERPPMTEYQALQIDRGEHDTFDYFVDEYMKEYRSTRETAENAVRQRASTMLEQAGSIATVVMAGLDNLVRSVSRVSGRKIIFFVTDGFFVDTRHSDTTQRLRAITSAAARSTAVIYSIDARGLIPGVSDASTQVAFDPSGRLSRGGMGEIGASQDAMNALAVDTGGRAFFNTNDFSASISKALKESSAYYLLAWRPETTEQRDKKYRRLEVSVVGRPELVVRFRQNVSDPPVEDGARASTAPAASPTPRNPNEGISAALRSPYPARSLPVSVALNFLDTAQYGNTLTASVKVVTRSLAVDTVNGNPTSTIDVAGAVFNDQGKSVSTFDKRFTIKITPNGAAIKPPDNLFYNHFALMKPGLYQVRIAAADVKTGVIGSAYEWIEIPDLQTKTLALSSLIVGERTDEITDPPDPSTNEAAKPSELRQVNLNVDHRFARSSSLRFLTFIYNAMTNSAAATNTETPAVSPTTTSPPDLAVQVQVFRDNQPVITAPLHKINVEGQADLQRVSYAADVLLNDLAPGQYLLQITVIDRIAKASATQKLSFQVE
jgi:VWFA-related protein